MFKELAADVPGFQAPAHGCLAGWARQGVLLLNAVLTVKAHEANSHANKGWEAFTDAVLALVAARCSHVVFVLWGAYAQKKGAAIDKKRHLVLAGPHPSPLSAHRGFFGAEAGCFFFLNNDETNSKQPKAASTFPKPTPF